jgi:hypothetical protein
VILGIGLAMCHPKLFLQILSTVGGYLIWPATYESLLYSVAINIIQSPPSVRRPITPVHRFTVLVPKWQGRAGHGHQSCQTRDQLSKPSE